MNSVIIDPSPISILSTISKFFEKLIYSRLTKFLKKHDILYKYQFGFRESHSTDLALNSLNSFISSAFENKQFALGIFLDFSKAFDTVNFKILLSKLAHYGIRGTPLKLLENYLLNRNRHVIFNDSVSNNEVIKTGVPQGSILGPLLFLIYVNDLPQMSKTFHTIMYADDSTYILFKGPSAGDLICTANQELKSVVNWLSQNKLSLNIKKCNYSGTSPNDHLRTKTTSKIRPFLSSPNIIPMFSMHLSFRSTTTLEFTFTTTYFSPKLDSASQLRPVTRLSSGHSLCSCEDNGRC